MTNSQRDGCIRKDDSRVLMQQPPEAKWKPTNGVGAMQPRPHQSHQQWSLYRSPMKPD